MKNDSIEMVEFRHSLGLTQAEAADYLSCTTQLVAHIERGRRGLGPYRSERLRQVKAAFAAGGVEAVAALPAFARPPRHRTKGGCKVVPAGDADEMTGWRVALNLTQREATRMAGLSIHSIRAIEQGYMRITDRVRENMASAERAATRNR